MGIHLLLVRTPKEITEESDLNYTAITDWDSDRYGGDKEFNLAMEKIWNQDLWRPIDLDKAREWIKAHIGPPTRLLLAMEMMETDRTIWFKTSW